MKTQRNTSSHVLAFTTAALLAAVAVGAQDVSIDYDHAANFAGIKTFAVKLGTPWGTRLASSV